MQITAAVVHEKSGPFVIDNFELEEPRPDEVLVRVGASGRCASDLHGRDGYYNTPYPCVYGHEGAGVVEAIGSSVMSLAVGDHVIMSFPWCGTCANCHRDMHSHCQNSFTWKFSGTRPDGSTLLKKNGSPVYSAYFQQSSFSSHTLANERFVVKVRKDAPLDVIGPFACSGQTGAGAVFNTMRPKPGDAFAVFGAGAVGLCALMAATVAGSAPRLPCVLHDRPLSPPPGLRPSHHVHPTA